MLGLDELWHPCLPNEPAGSWGSRGEKPPGTAAGIRAVCSVPLASVVCVTKCMIFRFLHCPQVQTLVAGVW